jgi:hypothetical protein
MVCNIPFIVSPCKASLSHKHPTSAVSYHDNWRAKGLDEANALYSLFVELEAVGF